MDRKGEAIMGVRWSTPRPQPVTRLTRRGERAVLAATAIAALTAGATAQLWNPYTRHIDRCQTVDLAEDTDGTGPDAHVAALLAAGWYGDPADHAERLYSPECAR